MTPKPLRAVCTGLAASPIPEPFKSAVMAVPDIALQIAEMVEGAKKNKEDATELAIYIANLSKAIIRALETQGTGTVTPEMEGGVAELARELGKVSENVKKLKSRKPWKRHIGFSEESVKLAGFKDRLSQAKGLLELENLLAVRVAVEEIKQEQMSQGGGDKNVWNELNQLLSALQGDRQLINLLGTGDMGSGDKERACLEGTREKVLRDIEAWAEEPQDCNNRILWLTGPAGTGKSAIVASLEGRLRAKGQLGAVFYFVREQPARNKQAVPKIARQLALHHPSLCAQVITALKADQDLPSKLFVEQYRQLIDEPLSSLPPGHRPTVIMMDALDECDKDYMKMILRLVVQSMGSFPPRVRFLFSSRVETYLQAALQSQELKPKVQHRPLDEEESAEVTRDIEEYLTRFSTKVSTVERLSPSNQWLVTTSDGSQLLAEKLVIATGLTSEPYLPTFEGQDAFTAPILHSKDLASRASELLETAKAVVICGGRKSAHDAVHLFASRGVKVHWVIRKTGHGAGWLAAADPPVPGLAFDQVPFIRAVSWLSPCIWGDADGYSGIRWFLHETRMGRWIVKSFWSSVTNMVLQQNKYDSNPKLQKLKPRCDVFWTGSTASSLNFDSDFFDLVKSDMVEIHTAEITQLSNRTVHLSSAETISADGLICCTGWRDTPPCKFLPEGMEKELGLPHSTTHSSSSTISLESEAQLEILRRFPMLANQPSITGDPDVRQKELSITPYRLYRFLVPPTTEFGRSIAFMGMAGVPAPSEIQALWCVAYLNGDLHRPEDIINSSETMMVDTIRATEWCRLRAPAGYGNRWPDFAFDIMPYHDLLLRDLGLPFRRKSSMLKEWFSPYGVKDYRGLVDEWLQKNRTH